MSKRKGKEYKPKRIVTPAMRSSPGPKMIRDLKLIAYPALDAVMRGHGDFAMFSCLAAAVNLTTVLAEKGKGSEYMGICQDAMAAVTRMGERGAKTDRYGLDGDGYQAIKLCLELHEEQLKISTRVMISNCIFEIERRLKQQQKEKKAELQVNENIA